MEILPFCVNCGHVFANGEVLFHSVKKIRWLRLHETCYICQKCSERENMPNIKITAEVDGKQVPLENISTESFEAIKALEKSKEIPVARVGNFPGNPNDRRLFLKITNSIRNYIVNRRDIKMIAIELKGGNVLNSWTKMQYEPTFHADGDPYENIKPL